LLSLTAFNVSALDGSVAKNAVIVRISLFSNLGLTYLATKPSEPVDGVFELSERADCTAPSAEIPKSHLKLSLTDRAFILKLLLPIYCCCPKDNVGVNKRIKQ